MKAVKALLVLALLILGTFLFGCVNPGGGCPCGG